MYIVNKIRIYNTYIILFICLINILFSYYLKYFFNLQICIVCFILLTLFKLIFIISLFNIFLKKYKYAFLIIQLIACIIGIYLSIKKILIKKTFIKDVNCMSFLENIVNKVHIKNITDLFSIKWQQCGTFKQYFIGIQIEFYVLFSLILILLFIFLSFKNFQIK